MFRTIVSEAAVSDRCKDKEPQPQQGQQTWRKQTQKQKQKQSTTTARQPTTRLIPINTIIRTGGTPKHIE